MGIELKQAFEIGKYLVTQRLKGNKKYPLVLMLEPLFRCNLPVVVVAKSNIP